MARNIEIKARVSDLAALRRKASLLAPREGEWIEQTDTFFIVPEGRLKVREFSNGTGELIAYRRPNQNGPKESDYTRVASDDPAVLRHALGSVLPVQGEVVKRREVFIVGRTRVHLDQVENLGQFVELEVVLQDDESATIGEQEALELMEALGISPGMLVADAYIDLLRRAPL